MARKVLIVDDDEMILEVLRVRLEDSGYEVVTHSRGLGTVQLLLEHKPDIVLLDVNLPMITGAQVAEIVRGKIGNTLVVLHSAKDNETLRELVRTSGAAGAIQKTGSEHEFMKRFAEIVGRPPNYR